MVKNMIISRENYWSWAIHLERWERIYRVIQRWHEAWERKVGENFWE
jgi:hypothetical protein